MTATEIAKRYLKIYYDAGGGAGFSFSEMIELMQSPTGTFLQNFGNSCVLAEKSIGADRMRDKMIELAKVTKGKVTTYQDGSFRGQEFFDILYRGVDNWDLKQLGRVTGDIISKGANAIAEQGNFILSTYVILGALGFAFAVYQLTKGKK